MYANTSRPLLDAYTTHHKPAHTTALSIAAAVERTQSRPTNLPPSRPSMRLKVSLPLPVCATCPPLHLHDPASVASERRYLESRARELLYPPQTRSCYSLVFALAAVGVTGVLACTYYPSNHLTACPLPPEVQELCFRIPSYSSPCPPTPCGVRRLFTRRCCT